MTPLAALALAAAATPGASMAEPAKRGVRIAAAQVNARIVQPAIVRQAAGLEQGRDRPAPQITRSGRTILVEYQ